MGLGCLSLLGIKFRFLVCFLEFSGFREFYGTAR